MRKSNHILHSDHRCDEYSTRSTTPCPGPWRKSSTTLMTTRDLFAVANLLRRFGRLIITISDYAKMAARLHIQLLRLVCNSFLSYRLVPRWRHLGESTKPASHCLLARILLVFSIWSPRPPRGQRQAGSVFSAHQLMMTQCRRTYSNHGRTVKVTEPCGSRRFQATVTPVNHTRLHPQPSI